jgi:hypothetical protein
MHDSIVNFIGKSYVHHQRNLESDHECMVKHIIYNHKFQVHIHVCLIIHYWSPFRRTCTLGVVHHHKKYTWAPPNYLYHNRPHTRHVAGYPGPAEFTWT